MSCSGDCGSCWRSPRGCRCAADLRALLVAALVDHDGRAHHQHLVDAARDVDPVRVVPAEEPLRHLRHGPAVPRERVLVLPEAPLGDQVVRTRHVDGEVAPEEREHGLLDDRRDLAVADDLVRRAPREDLLADRRHLASAGVRHDERVTQREHLAVDEVRLAIVLVPDGIVVAPAEPLLLHQVARHTLSETSVAPFRYSGGSSGRSAAVTRLTPSRPRRSIPRMRAAVAATSTTRPPATVRDAVIGIPPTMNVMCESSG